MVLEPPWDKPFPKKSSLNMGIARKGGGGVKASPKSVGAQGPRGRGVLGAFQKMWSTLKKVCHVGFL